ncbi:hypothetical protein D3C76_1200360 [compost metagenome]
MDAVDEVTVDLHVVRAQLRPQAQARIAGAEVVEGDGKTHVAVVVQGVEQQLEVVGRRLFGELDHHPAGRHAKLVEHLQGTPGLVLRLEQGFRRDVEEQLAFEVLLAEAPAGALAAGHFQLGQAAGLAGHGEQVDRRVQRAVGRAAAQCFVAEDAPFGQADNGLEQAVQAALSQDGAQRAELFVDGHGRATLKKRD